MALPALSLCAGIGGIDLGLAEWCRTVCFLERDAFAASVLVARMEEAKLDRAPVWDDLRSFDGKRWRGEVSTIYAACYGGVSRSRGILAGLAAIHGWDDTELYASGQPNAWCKTLLLREARASRHAPAAPKGDARDATP